tara:strand:- start:1010 stop:1894 length:885 start_codon:yes stop_codon:yes gene_type:complete
MKKNKGIVLAGGLAKRLRPITSVVSKQLLPVYDKPMIYYPISVLMLADIQDILIISSSHDINNFKLLLGDGSHFGVNFSYCVQSEPRGLAEALILGETFLADDNPVVILGDNIFYGQGFSEYLGQASGKQTGATIFGYKVKDPSAYGVVEVDENLKVASIFEKPEKPKSNIAVTGLYFYDSDAVEIAKSIKPSSRGELEITSVNQHYLEQDQLDLLMLGRGFTWLDTGTPQSLLEASQFVQAIEKSQGFKIACLEEIAFNKNWINAEEIKKNISFYQDNSYGSYLGNLIQNSSE